MNASVTPIVAGELAHGAFQHGFESYGVDILRRVAELGKRSGGTLHCSYTGAFPPPPPRTFIPLDLTPLANMDAALLDSSEAPDWRRGEHPDLCDLPKGEQVFAGVPFRVPEGPRGAIGLSRRAGYAPQVELPVHTRAAAIYFLHTLARTVDGVGGVITLHYADGTSHTQYVLEGRHALPISHWIYPELHYDVHDKRRAEVAWRGVHPGHLNQQVVVYGLDNPHPERVISHITLEAAANGGMWFVLGVTISDTEVYFTPDPVSFGIPNGWGAAAVVYALIEGLAGVVDAGVACDRVDLSPRWTAAGVEQVSVTVHYPESGGYVAYNYRRDVQNDALVLDLTGSGDSCACHVLLPEEAGDVVAVGVDGTPVDWTLSRVEGSRYVAFVVSLPGPHQIIIRLR